MTIYEKTDPGEFSVCQFFNYNDDNGANSDNSECYDYEVRYVTAEVAIEKFIFLTNNVAAQVGVTRRVIVTDGDDYTTLEWKFGEGITFPPELVGKKLQKYPQYRKE